MIQVCLITCSPAVEEAGSNTRSLIIIGQGVDDWSGIKAAAVDPPGDGPEDGVDLLQLKTSSQNGWLQFYFEIGEEMVLQRRNTLNLLIDADADAATGWQQGGLGVELQWTFGTRRGSWYDPSGEPRAIDQTDLAIRCSPTFSASIFELAIGLDAVFDATPLFDSEMVSIALWDGVDEGDRLPDNDGIQLEVLPSQPVELPVMAMDRSDPTHLRILQHNVLDDGILKRPEIFRRMYQAAAPDLLLLGETYNAQPDEILALIEAWFPLGGSEEEWQAIRHQDGSMLVSRYPVSMLEQENPGTTDAFLLKLPQPWETDLVVVHGWAMCCDEDSLRQAHCDGIMANIRDLRQNHVIPDDTPMILSGDFNLVTWSRHYLTLRDGSISNEEVFGPTFSPDPAGRSFIDLNPRSLSQAMDYTWRNDSMSFSPGRLDFMFYTGSLLKVGKHFVFDDVGMSDSTLHAYGLNAGDVSRAADHLPVVADFYPIRGR